MFLKGLICSAESLLLGVIMKVTYQGECQDGVSHSLRKASQVPLGQAELWDSP